MSKFFSRLWLLLTLASFWGTAGAAQLKVAVASNFKPVLATLAATFEQETGHSLLISAASSGVLYNQIIYGAPFDLFLSADVQRSAQLEERGLTLAGSRQLYASGVLVLWRPRVDKRRSALTLNDLIDHQGRLAIANPATAPYGVGAQQVLENLGLWPSIQSRLVKGASIAQAWQFVASGNAPAGLVAKSQVKDHVYDTTRVLQIPDSMYQPIKQELVILKRTREPEAARALADFLLSPAAQKIIAENGYNPMRKPEKWPVDSHGVVWK